jgi:class 3 adenylate cyclase/tetratricopeptide (TPR) repeat protein
VAASAAPIAGTGPAAERRLVTILFADLVGFTPYSEDRDPEEVRETLTRYFDVAREVIERYGGSVEKFIGDAVMAVWGAPVAHEDDAERGVRAALELLDAVRELGADLQARAGVLTGDAAVTLGATGQGMVAGDLVNTTARVQAIADPGTVLVGEATMRSASGAVVFESAGERDLKGKTAPVPVWRALRVVAERGGRGRSDGLEAPFVGRDIEFRLLKELVHASGREKRVRLVSITGQAGIGKSRLAWELLKYIDGVVETVWWHHGRSPAYGSGITFWALGEMVRWRCGLAEGDDESTTRGRVAEAVTRFVPEGTERAWIEAALLKLLGVGEAAATSEELFPAWRSFFEHIARQGTTIMVFEDLQWADPGLLAFIDHLMGWSHELPICIVALARPELLEAHPTWGSAHRGFTSMSLGPLDRESMVALLAGLVPGLPRATSDRIIERADGIPLYAVETVRMLVADGRLVLEDGVYRPAGDLSELEAPESLRSLVGSRLDALEPQDRQLLQSAAVLGHSFTVEGLDAVTGAAGTELDARLRPLVRREMLTHRADPRSPERGQYAFAQEILREVAYETLARDDRRVLHLAAARYFESLDTDELAGALAAQYEAAHRNSRPGPETDALAIQARLALKGAAERAMTLGSTEQAEQLFGSALELASNPVEQVALLESVGRAASMAGHGEQAQRMLERAIAIHLQSGQRSAAASTTAELVNATFLSSQQLEAAMTRVVAAVDQFEDLGLDAGLVRLLAQQARFEMLRGEDLPAAVATSDRALAMAEQLDLVDVVADLLVTRGSALAAMGRSLEGLGAIEAGRRIAAAEGLTSTEYRALLNASGPLGDSDPRAFLEASVAALELARRTGSRPSASAAVNNVAEAARMCGEWELALAELRREAELCDGDDLMVVRAGLMMLDAERGIDVSATESELDAYAEDQLARGEPRWRSDVDTYRAIVTFAAGRYGEAAAGFMAQGRVDPMNASGAYGMATLAAMLARDVVATREALTALEGTGKHGAIVKLERRRAVAGIAALEGRHAEALAGFRGVQEELRSMDLPYLLALTDLVMCELLDPALPEVTAAAEEARAIFARLGAQARLDRLAEALARGATPGAGSAPRASARSTPTPAN